MSMLVSGSHPAQAGLQAPVVELLLDFAADSQGLGNKKGASLQRFTALVSGMIDAAQELTFGAY
jgi:hypothetical protein